MPDWKTLVRERMGTLGFSWAQEEEIVSELASHLEDCYEEFRTQGICKSEAVERSLEQVAAWPSLSGKIKRAKRKEEMMNHRTKTLWLPALISLTAAMVFLMASTIVARQPWVLAGRFINVPTSTTNTNYQMAAYLPWLISLPLCGAVGAYFSCRAGGGRAARLVAGLFPWIALFGLIGFLTVIGRIVPFQHQWIRFVTGLLLVSVPPGIALFLGVIPFLREDRSSMLVNH
jgi:hypothetical protein